ncbi:MBL fold metallo-hydrolase RNA specificity domain-containing protein [Streptomyces sp. G1]|uniref:MBL fold metallo-hydrolase RNA specificity domain-containing protein n=1 Tax=Streptomyces sp. G1 TaxID=361572 RepID=UPI0020307E7B|nr:MBL fold metallo-hydrolase RNA specificity domain-containing protein [Streptomyces sp. G1]MCM1973027.1 hypothetical protein [Streptomyces sp. G1]
MAASCDTSTGSCPTRAAPWSSSASPPRAPAHADADQIIDWLRAAPPPHTTYLVHGEESAAETLRDRIDHELGWTAVVPRTGEAAWSADRSGWPVMLHRTALPNPAGPARA